MSPSEHVDLIVAGVALLVACINGGILLYQNRKLHNIHSDINGRVAELVALRVRAEVAGLMLIAEHVKDRKEVELRSQVNPRRAQ